MLVDAFHGNCFVLCQFLSILHIDGHLKRHRHQLAVPLSTCLESAALGPYPAVGLLLVILHEVVRGAWGGYLVLTLNGYLKLYFFLPDICWFAVLPNVPPPYSFDFFSHLLVTFLS